MENSYYSVACNDYGYVTSARVFKCFNNDASGCQQVIEKLLKSVIVETQVVEHSLKTHDLHKLYCMIKSVIKIPDDMEYKLCKITDYYFDARYPGDDFVVVTKEESDMCFEVMESVYKLVTEFHAKNKTQLDEALNMLTGGE